MKHQQPKLKHWTGLSSGQVNFKEIEMFFWCFVADFE